MKKAEEGFRVKKGSGFRVQGSGKTRTPFVSLNPEP
jgi:hypothetical protein